MVYIKRSESQEIYNALCCLNVAIREKQPQRAMDLRRWIRKWNYINQLRETVGEPEKHKLDRLVNLMEKTK